MNSLFPMLANLPGGADANTTVVVVGTIIVLMQAATLAKGLFGKKEGVELKQPVQIEGGGEPLRTIMEPKLSEKYVHRRDHDGLTAEMRRLEQTVKDNTASLHAEIKETAEKSEERTAKTHERINSLAEALSGLAGEIRRDREARAMEARRKA